MTLEELNVVITAQNEKFKKQMDDVQSQIKGLKNQGAAASKTLSKMFNFQILSVGVRLIKSAYQQILNLSAGYFDKIEQETKLAEVMRQRMNATNSQITAIKKLTEQEQSLGVVEDDVLMAGLQQLGTFSKYPSTLETLNGAMANLIAQQKGYDSTAQDAITIGNLMGKVLQGQTSALTRVGITFTAAQEEVLKYGNEQERAAMLAQVITDNVGNMNAALLNTPRGRLKQLQISLDDIKDSLTEGILSPLMAILPYVNNIVSKGQLLAKYFSATMQGLFGKVDTSSLTQAKEANEDLAESVEAVGEAYNEGSSSIDEFNIASGFSNQTNEVIEDVGQLEEETEEVADAIQEAVQPVVNFLKENKDLILGAAKGVGFLISPLTRIATIIGVIIDEIKSSPELSEGFSKMFKQMQEILPSVSRFFAEIGESLGDIILTALTMILNVWDRLGPSLIQVIEAIFEVLVEIVPVIAEILKAVSPVITVIAEGLYWIIDLLSSVGALKPIIAAIIGLMIGWKIATLALAAAQWLHNASLLAKIGLMTFGAGLIIAGLVGAASMAFEDKANEIPQYASGANNIPRGQLFVAREKGPEIVGTNPSGGAAVMNNFQIVESVSEGVAKAIQRSGGLGINGNQVVKVEIGFNSTEAARILQPKLEYEKNRSGGKR